MIEISIWLVVLIAIIAVWDLVWKLLATWKAAKKNSVIWFIVLMVLNTIGILPILYYYWFSALGKLFSLVQLAVCGKRGGNHRRQHCLPDQSPRGG